jgi:RecT family
MPGRKQTKTRPSQSRRRSAPRPQTATTSPSSAIVPVAQVVQPPSWKLSSEEITILKNSIAKGATDTELVYLLKVAERRKLDPFKQQIWFVRRWDKNADNGAGGTGANVWTAQVGIDGLLFTAARDHKDEFGSVSLPEYGPMVGSPAHPESALIKVWKKGETEPTVAQAWWDEYAPADLTKAPFWRRMPRRMIAKCATALAIRQAYPDLGGMYIPEEMEKMREDYTPEGRQIVPANAPTARPYSPPEERGDQDQAIANLKAKGMWCDEHQTTRSSKHAQTCPSTKAALEAILAPKPTPKQESQVIDVKPTPSQPPKQHPPLQEGKLITVDWQADPQNPRVIGDVQELKKSASKLKWDGGDQFYHCNPFTVEDIRADCIESGIEFREIMANLPEPEKRKRASKQEAKQGKPTSTAKEQVENKPAGGAGKTQAAEPELMKGFVEQADLRGEGKPRLAVLFKSGTTKYSMSAWNDNHFKPLFAARDKKLECEIFIKKTAKDDKVFTNIVGLKRVGTVEFDADGKTPVVSVHREPGTTPTLFQ